MIKFILLAMMCLSALAQPPRTALRPDQLRVFPPQGSRPVLLAFEDGGFFPLTLGPSLGVTKTASGWEIFVISLPPKPPVVVRTETVVTAAPDGTYPLTDKGVLYRNGLRMAVGIDYTRANGRAAPLTPWSTSDTVLVEEISTIDDSEKK